MAHHSKYSTNLFTALISVEIAAILFIGFSLREYVYPATFAVILVYVSLPAIEFLEQKCRLPRVIAVGLIFIFQLLILTAITVRGLPILFREISSLLKTLPSSARNVLDGINQLSEQYGLGLSMANGALEQKVSNFFRNLAQLDVQALQRTVAFAQGTANQLISYVSWFVNILLVPILYFFLGFHCDQIIAGIERYTPTRYREKLSHLLQELNTILSCFLRGQLMLILSLGTCYIIAFNAIGVPNATTLGVVTGILSFIPFIGSLTGMTIATLSLYATKASVVAFATLGAAYLLIGTLESIIFIPYFIGNSLGMSTFTSLIVLIIATKEIGAIGLILGIPIAAILKHLFLSFADLCRAEKVI